MSGIVYCFNTVADSKVIKCGHTQQDLTKRLRGYLGPSKPRMLIFKRSVADSAASEQVMLLLMRQCRSLKCRLDLGNEWFEIVEDMEVTLQHLVQIADVVRLTSSTPEKNCVLPVVRTAGLSREQVMASLRTYLKALDTYVRDVAPPTDFVSAEELMKNFDASTSCPVFAEYLPVSDGLRLDVIRKRYAEVLQG